MRGTTRPTEGNTQRDFDVEEGLFTDSGGYEEAEEADETFRHSAARAPSRFTSPNSP
jgi:hypothetical protein